MDDITWSILTHEHKDRSTDWYWAFGILSIIGIIVSIYFMNILLAIILAVGLSSIIILTVRGPREHEVTLSPKGITVDGTLYRYPSIQSFWVSVEDPEIEDIDPRVRLFVTTSGYLHPRLILPLYDTEHAVQVREYLIRHIDEQEQDQHFAEHLAEIAGL